MNAAEFTPYTGKVRVVAGEGAAHPIALDLPVVAALTDTRLMLPLGEHVQIIDSEHERESGSITSAHAAIWGAPASYKVRLDRNHEVVFVLAEHVQSFDPETAARWSQEDAEDRAEARATERVDL